MWISFDGRGDVVIRDGESGPQAFATWVPPAIPSAKSAWRHIAVVANSGEVKVYIDGVALRPYKGL